MHKKALGKSYSLLQGRRKKKPPALFRPVALRVFINNKKRLPENQLITTAAPGFQGNIIKN